MAMQPRLFVVQHLGALNGDAKWEDSVMQLMDAVDSYIPVPVREVDKPFLMSVEDVFTITGRGTVVTGRIERGVVNTGEEVEIIGMREENKKSTVTGVEMFRKTLDRGEAGDNVGLFSVVLKRMMYGEVWLLPNQAALPLILNSKVKCMY